MQLLIMIKALKKFIGEHKLFVRNDALLLACSGGMDSMVLLDLLNKSDYKFNIAHCNFKLRGEESDEDEAFVIEEATKRGIHCFSKSFDTENFAAENKLSIQEAARNLRYQWFEQIATTENNSKILTAHHADDLMETFFINLFRGSGLSGLASIPLTNGNIVRPLLFARRFEIETYAKQNEIKYRDDSSNKKDYYLRNKIRHHLIPLVEQLKENAGKSIIDSINHLKGEEAVIDYLLEKNRWTFIESRNNDLFISYTSVLSCESPVLLFKYLNEFGFNYEQCSEAFILSESRQSGKCFISTTYKLTSDREGFYLAEIKGVSEEVFVFNSFEDLQNNNFEITPFEFRSALELNAESSSEIVADADKILFPLKLRPWKEGDYFKPFGMKNRKKLSDYFIDHKMPRINKDNIQVLEDSENEIIWVVKCRMSDKLRVVNSTKYCVKIKVI